MLPARFEVLERRVESADTVTLTVAPLDPDPRVGVLPGQFNMLYAFGVGEVPISVSGRRVGSGALEHTLRAVGHTTAALCGLAVGEQLGVRGPFGRGWPLDRFLGYDLVVIGGGIGLAPLRPVIRAVLEQRRAFGRLVVLYGARTPADLLFADEIESWRRAADTQIEVTVDRADDSDWTGPVGVVPRLLARARFDPIETGVFLCGPEVMIDPCARELCGRGLPPERMYVSLERNMHCAIGVCGHCQLGPRFICRDGPVFPLSSVESLLRTPEL